VPQLNQLYHDFTDRVAFRMIYIAEAHALDEWPMGDGYPGSEYQAIPQPKSVEERCGVAKFFRSEISCDLPMVIDGPDDLFEKKYSVWPLRFYIIHRGKIVYKAQPTDSYRYSVAELRDKVAAMVDAASS